MARPCVVQEGKRLAASSTCLDVYAPRRSDEDQVRYSGETGHARRNKLEYAFSAMVAATVLDSQYNFAVKT